jgi:hypothetical protein
MNPIRWMEQSNGPSDTFRGCRASRNLIVILEVNERFMLSPGDVFAVKVPNGMFDAVRVLRKVAKSSLVSTSQYLGHELPSLDEPLLFKSVMQKRFFYDGMPARKWLNGKPPKCFQFVGNVPATKEEAERECSDYGGKWRETSGNESDLEWRWIHERPAFEEEVRKQQEEFERRRRLPQKPKNMMSEEEFWAVISLLDWKHQGKDEKVLAPAIKALASKSKAEICRFAERFAFVLYQLDTKAHASNMGEQSYDPKSDYVSADGFLYARCVVVANGREFYETVLNDPTKMPKDMEFESLLGLASSAYEQKTGEEFEYSTGCSFESFSNRGGWQANG